MTDLSKDKPTQEQKPVKKVAALFDLRLIIGALFTLYGIVLIITGITDGTQELNKASGIRINLWAGLGMLVTGLLFLLWMKLTGDGHDRPQQAGSGDEEGRPAAAAGEGSPAA
jgi:H+/Cl- antiporter ClcA